MCKLQQEAMARNDEVNERRLVGEPVKYDATAVMAVTQQMVDLGRMLEGGDGAVMIQAAAVLEALGRLPVADVSVQAELLKVLRAELADKEAQLAHLASKLADAQAAVPKADPEWPAGEQEAFRLGALAGIAAAPASAQAVPVAPVLTAEQIESVMKEWDRSSNNRIHLCRLIEREVLKSVAPAAPARASVHESVRDDPQFLHILDGLLGMDGGVFKRLVAYIDSRAPAAPSAAKVSARAADALDSQPTDSSMPVDMSQAKRWIVQLRGRVETLLAIINEKVPASSQPTDDRCAKCGLHCKAGACIYGQPTDGEVRNG